MQSMPAPGCDLASRAWRQTSLGPCPESIWRFTARPDGSWLAAETGCSGAAGIAHYDGVKVRLDFQSGDAVGRYTWQVDAECRAAPGIVQWTTGPAGGQTAAASWTPVN
jgi:hypothetical protein